MLLAELSSARWVVGLPGNPYAALVAARTLLGPLVAGLSGRRLGPLVPMPVHGQVKPTPGHTRLVPVAWAEDGCRIIGGHRAAFCAGPPAVTPWPRSDPNGPTAPRRPSCCRGVSGLLPLHRCQGRPMWTLVDSTRAVTVAPTPSAASPTASRGTSDTSRCGPDLHPSSLPHAVRRHRRTLTGYPGNGPEAWAPGPSGLAGRRLQGRPVTRTGTSAVRAAGRGRRSSLGPGDRDVVADVREAEGVADEAGAVEAIGALADASVGERGDQLGVAVQ